MASADLESINYRLKIQGEIKQGDEQYRDLILKTMIRLPDDVREKILDEALFIIATPSVNGTIFDLIAVESLTLHCILLNFSSMGRFGDSKKMDVIAHEIAHVILGHGTISTPQQKKEADDLSQSWGFKRAYLEST